MESSHVHRTFCAFASINSMHTVWLQSIPCSCIFLNEGFSDPFTKLDNVAFTFAYSIVFVYVVPCMHTHVHAQDVVLQPTRDFSFRVMVEAFLLARTSV